ncbi:hypothetical protein DICPUDRAFT_41918 [Dictyostelium purpureum]|uniref:UBA domain-containing protein n=1 Tax=Dictyostelium purpureum TaxID=5786 RepID=F1A136_DICPU|nr:uncharacterized protein DICPUDRAFT_41918 [Dictyostelium purpureum]EGC30090.1 hypothetical protein DICPUDRAFT_41918 [Dictyostelium purpureum]|eukprot:XP_003293377.1 hypothetical protein DICPUDRAFT_41918 [Dictyostelium purpureum]
MWFKLFKVPLTDKSITYFFAIQTMFGFPQNFTSNLIGVASGMIASSSVLGLSSLNFPRKVRAISKRIFLPLLQSQPPNTSYRQYLERQQRRGHNLYMNDNPMAAFQQQINHNITQMNQPPVVQPQVVQPSEDNIETLVSMGFPRERAIQVLQRTNNNLNEAASII